MQTVPKYIIGIGENEQSASIEQAGGKGANLTRLAQAGLPVPPGFILTTGAYRAFVETTGLKDRIVARSRDVDSNDPLSFDSASIAIRALFDEAVLPPELENTIRQAYHTLAQAGERDPAVAVRSSATAEDLPDASFAGQQETYLNVRGEDALLDAVKRCWSSLWTARAIAYRARQNIYSASVSLAVVVQRMVAADAAGILFTMNPVTSNRDQVVINAAWGLGEAIVGGLVSPDTLIVDKANGEIRETEIGDKAVMTSPVEQGTDEVTVDEAKRRQLAITAGQASELVRLGNKIETAFGRPQDIEWAIAGEKVYILQARPVTAQASTELPKVPGDDDWPSIGMRPPQPFDRWTNADMGERYPDPVTPLTWSFTTAITNDNMAYTLRGINPLYLNETQWVQRFYGHVYLNEGAMARVLNEEFGMPSSFTDDALGSGPGEKNAASQGFRFDRLLRAMPLFIRVSGERMKNEKLFQESFPQIEAWVRDSMQQDLGKLSDQDLLKQITTVWMPRVTDAINLHGDVTSTSMTSLPMLEKMMQSWAGRKELAHDMVTGLTGVESAGMVPALWHITQKIRELGLEQVILDNDAQQALAQLRQMPESQPVMEMLDEFLAHHGHRTAMEAEFLYPRWAEAPEQVIESLTGYLKAGDQLNPFAAEAAQRQRRDAAIAAVEQKLDPVRRAIVKGMLARTQHLVRLRDNGQHFLVKLMLPVRRIYAELGRRWAERGWLRQADDIFFMVIPEVEAIGAANDQAALGVDLQKLVDDRRKAYEYWFTVKAPDVIGADGKPVEVQSQSLQGDYLPGVAASGGRVRGAARILTHPQEAARLQSNDILVTRSTDPGWTPVFPLVKGLVMEIGGQLSHGAIVAREYGIPAVINVQNATHLLEDGQMITLDGTAGRVYLNDALPEVVPPAPVMPVKPHAGRYKIAVVVTAVASVVLLWRLVRKRK